MLKFIVLGVILLLAALFIFGPKNTTVNNASKNTEVMYGYSDYNEYLKNRPSQYKTADDAFVASVTAGGKAKSQASQEVCDTGNSYLNKNDLNTAMKRYNQAWLLDQNQPCIYIGFGYILSGQKKFDESFQMFEKGISLADPSSKNDAENPWWMYDDYAEAQVRCYLADSKRTECLDKAFENIKKSQTIKDTAKTHRVLAIAYFAKKDFVNSWTELHYAIDNGVPKEAFGNLINDLKKQMPDPKGIY